MSAARRQYLLSRIAAALKDPNLQPWIREGLEASRTRLLKGQ